MFWLNSRSALVTATSLSRGWHPFSRTYGANLPSSLTNVVSATPYHALVGAPVSVLGTDRTTGSRGIFTGSKHRQKGPEGPRVAHSPRSRHDGTPEASAFTRTGKCGPRSSQRLTPGQKSLWRRNINLLPFRVLRLRAHLGPANPRLTIIVEETWPFRRSGFSPLFAVTHTRILVPTRSTRAHARASTRAGHHPTQCPCGAAGVSVIGLAPSIFRAHDLDQ
jgi:hypothetical protein